MNFASDNTAGMAPEILQAIVAANDGYAPSYGADDITRRVERRLAELFEHEVAVFIVPTGTAANALSLAHVSPPWGAVLCHAQSHIATDECGAPEFFGGGLKLVGLEGDGCKITSATLADALRIGPWGGPHHVTASALSLTQATEAGTVYSLDELATLARMAHDHGAAVHMDGARFANALVHLDVSPAAMTWKAGVDVLSLGATKAGALAAEAVVFFDVRRAEGMLSRRKRAAQLFSKHRFAAAQLDAYLTDGLWLNLARHANRMADKLGAQLSRGGCTLVWPVQANEVFVLIPPQADRRLKNAGAAYHAWLPGSRLPQGVAAKPGEIAVRLVTSFATTPDDVERFVTTALSG